jgi:hypothetical protein
VESCGHGLEHEADVRPRRRLKGGAGGLTPPKTPNRGSPWAPQRAFWTRSSVK